MGLKKSLEDETINHENQITEIRHKHSAESAELNNQLDQLKRLKAQLEKQSNQLKTDNDEMTNELKTVSGSKAENERKRKQLEMQVNELQMKLQESERVKEDSQDKLSKVITELDLMSTAL